MTVLLPNKALRLTVSTLARRNQHQQQQKLQILVTEQSASLDGFYFSPEKSASATAKTSNRGSVGHRLPPYQSPCVGPSNVHIVGPWEVRFPVWHGSVGPWEVRVSVWHGSNGFGFGDDSLRIP